MTFNRKRIVEVWFDDYKKFVYERNRAKYEKIDVGDLSEAIKLREKLKCKNFDYFINEIAPDLVKKFPTVEKQFARGLLQLKNTDLCITIIDQSQIEEDYDVILVNCEEAPPFELSWYRDLRIAGNVVCLDSNDISKGGFCE